jgi:glutamate-ammonia-ligase adenylyltransferase
MTSPTVEGTLYEIDTRLRPSGTFGPIVTSLTSFKDYHARSAWFWERQALIKARPIAGDEGLYEPVSEILDDIVYGKALTEEDRKALLEIRAQMEREIAKESAKRKHIKAGYGGLVDIEFLIQYLQMKEGGKSPSLRHSNTLKALGELEKIGVFASPMAQELREAYIFLRRLENRIQILENRSSPFFNPEGEELTVLARRMGYRRKGTVSAAEKFYEDYRLKTTRVRQIFIERIGDPKKSGQDKKS